MRVLVVTIVHRPDDARILHRQIAILRQEGAEVTYAAPFSAVGTPRPDGLRTIDLPRAAGRDRRAAIRTARSMIKAEGPRHDVVLLHDPELLVAIRGLDHPAIVWDVHEDTAAAMSMKGWVPGPAKPAARTAARWAERWAERHVHLILAEDGYLERFSHPHPVVPNSTWVAPEVAPPGDDRAVYVGALTRARGALDLAATGRALAGSGITVHVVGHADTEVEPTLRQAHDDGSIVWHGFLPNDEALTLLSGALAGLSLLHDEANYRHSRPTKVIEYMSRGIPVVSTPNPPAQALIESAACGIVVPFQAPDAVADAVRQLAADPARRTAMGAAGHAVASAEFNWAVDGRAFVDQLRRWAAS
jgi:glycosyltransferase involved in cell wall biosynthesis